MKHNFRKALTFMEINKMRGIWALFHFIEILLGKFPEKLKSIYLLGFLHLKVVDYFEVLALSRPHDSSFIINKYYCMKFPLGPTRCSWFHSAQWVLFLTSKRRWWFSPHAKPKNAVASCVPDKICLLFYNRGSLCRNWELKKK